MRQELDRILTRYRLAKEQEEEASEELKKWSEQHEDLLTVQKVIQETAELVQRQAHEKVSKIVTRCLHAVFGEEAYTFRIDFVQRRGKTEAELLLVRMGKTLHPCDSVGGGVCDVVAFALRLAALVLTRPKRRQLLILDEPFKHLSAEYRERVAMLLETLSEEMDIQMMIVSHHPELQIGKVITL